MNNSWLHNSLESAKSFLLNWHIIPHFKKGARIHTLRVLSRFFHIDDVLTSQYVIYSEMNQRHTKWRQWNGGWSGVESKKIICQGFTLWEALSWMLNVAKLMPVSDGKSGGLATSALWEETTTKCCCWEFNEAAVCITRLCKFDTNSYACNMMFALKMTAACCVQLEKCCLPENVPFLSWDDQKSLLLF